VFFDLGNGPHVRLVGGTGSAKGYVIRSLEVQALRAGWLGITLDGGNSSEHAGLDAAPTWLRPMRAQMTLPRRLGAALVHVKMLKALADARTTICEAFDARRWEDLPRDVLAWLPKIAMPVDEVTAMLAESKDKGLDALRKALATALDNDGLRNGRKFGIHLLPLADQFAYSAVFSKGAQQQAERWVVLGNLAPEHVRQVTGLAKLPPVPDAPRCGHTGRFGNPFTVELRIPNNLPDSLDRAVQWVVDHQAELVVWADVVDLGELGEGRIVLRPPPPHLVDRYKALRGIDWEAFR
jgi:hypothetical protein